VTASRRIVCARIGLVLLFALLAAECLYFLAHGRFNIDEGLHLNAGRLLFSEGRIPYRDFPFSQGPGGPFFYGLGELFFGASLLVGRSLSVGVNLAAIAAMMVFAGRLAGPFAAGLVALLTMINIPAVWTFAQVRTEPASIPLVVLAVVALCWRGGSALRWALAPCLLVWATSVRLTSLFALLAVCAIVAFELRHAPRTLAKVGGWVALNGVLAAWPILFFPRHSFFHIVASQLGRTERFEMGDYPFSMRFWFFVDPHTSFQPLLLLCIAPVFVLLRAALGGWRPRAPRSSDPASVIFWLMVLGLLTYLPHMILRIGFFHYFVTASVLLTLAIAIALPLLVRDAGHYRVVVLCGVGLAVAMVMIGGANLGWKHRDKWVFAQRPTVHLLAPLRERMRALSPDGCRVLTFQTNLAVETGCELLHGLEYSFFSFFPHLSDEEAEQRGVLNQALLLASLERDQPEFVVLTRKGAALVSEPPKPPPGATGKVRTLREEQERIRREGFDRAESKARGSKPILEPMRGRYRLLQELLIPTGPVHSFWSTAYVYARSDLLPADPSGP